MILGVTCREKELYDIVCMGFILKFNHMEFTGTAKVLQTRKELESQEPIEKTHQSKPP
jgi:hypothetical protein